MELMLNIFLGLFMGIMGPPNLGSSAISWLPKASFHFKRKDRAALVVLCERKTAGPAGRGAEKLGKTLLYPFLKIRYATLVFLAGKKAEKHSFFRAVQKLAQKGRIIDIYIFAHGSPSRTYFYTTSFTPQELVENLKGKGGKQIHMVYTTTCYSQPYFLQAWKEVGARAARGMSGINRPLDFPRFFIGWLLGETYQEANQKGYQWNGWLHYLLAPLQPILKKVALWGIKKTLAFQPSHLWERRCQKKLFSFFRLLKGWFQEPWRLQDSYPHIYGGNIRIDRN